MSCWPTVCDLISKGDIDAAVAFCKREPCSTVMNCQRFLGWTYYERDDLESALTWFSKAADQGDCEAYFGIGCIYYCRREFPVSVHFFQLAADRGYGRACHWLGFVYRNGLGVTQSDDVAVDWYKQGADKGYFVAERALLHLRWNKSGVMRRVFLLARLFRLIPKAILLGLRNIHDPRLADLPNVFNGGRAHRTF